MGVRSLGSATSALPPQYNLYLPTVVQLQPVQPQNMRQLLVSTTVPSIKMSPSPYHRSLIRTDIPQTNLNELAERHPE